MANKELLDHELCQQLAVLIDKVTTSGQTILDVPTMKSIKQICKKSDEYVKHCFHICMTQLEKEHAEMRLSCVLIIDELFNRSHCFREKLLLDFQNFMELTLETNPDFPLPPPKKAATTLRGKTIRFIHQWHTKFGDTYKKLSLAYNFLRQCKKVDFGSMEARSEAERRRSMEQRERSEQQQRVKVEAATEEITELKTELRNVLIQSDNCMMLLLPEPESFDINGLQSPDPHRMSGSSPWGLKSPNPYISSNPWRRSSIDNQNVVGSQKSRDRSKVKSSRKSRSISDGDTEDLKSSVKLTKLTTVSTSNQENGECNLVKLEPCEYCNSQEKEGINCKCTCGQANAKYLQNQSIICDNNDETKKGTPNLERNSLDTHIKLEYVKTDSDACCSKVERYNDTVLNSSNAEDSDDFQEISSDDSDISDLEDEEDEELEDDYEDYDPMSPMSRQHGFNTQYGSGLNVTIEITPDVVHITETPDNEDVINALRDSVQLLDNKFLVNINKNMEVFTKAGVQDQIRRCLDIKSVIENMKNKVAKLKFVRMSKVKQHRNSIKSNDDSDSDADDFEDVPDTIEKEGYEPRIPDHLREEYGLVDNKIQKSPTQPEWTVTNSASRENNVNDPTTFAATQLLQRLKETSDAYSSEANTSEKSASTSNVKKTSEPSNCLRTTAPLVPFNTDLHYWGQDVEAPILVRYDSEHRFWVNKDGNDDVVDKSALSSMTSRLINYTGKFQPVTHRCNAPLPSGKLCPRMDRVKCPFHGKIIPRNAVGQPTNIEDKIRLEAEQEKKQQDGVPEWEDPALQQDILAATGVDVSRKGKGKGGKGKKGKAKRQKKNQNLAYVGPLPVTSRGRLEAKIFNDRTMKRVASKLDGMDAKRHKDKFANQFHYALKNK